LNSIVYSKELEIKETTETASSSSFRVIYLIIDTNDINQTDNRDNFNFAHIHIPTSPANGDYISQLVRQVRASSVYSDFLKRHMSSGY